MLKGGKSRVMVAVFFVRSRGSVFGKTTQYRHDESTKSSALQNPYVSGR